MTGWEKLKHAFEQTPSVFNLLTTSRSRRVGRGYRIGAGTNVAHPVTGRELRQAAGPMKFVSNKDPKPLTRVEEAYAFTRDLAGAGAAVEDREPYPAGQLASSRVGFVQVGPPRRT